MSDDWFRMIAAESKLLPDDERQLCEFGFVVLPGPSVPGGLVQLSDAYDKGCAGG